jgi:hypothetical protein
MVAIFLVTLASRGQAYFLHDTQADPRVVDRLGKGLDDRKVRHPRNMFIHQPGPSFTYETPRRSRIDHHWNPHATECQTCLVFGLSGEEASRMLCISAA